MYSRDIRKFCSEGAPPRDGNNLGQPIGSSEASAAVNEVMNDYTLGMVHNEQQTRRRLLSQFHPRKFMCGPFDVSDMVPILSWIKDYDFNCLKADVVAGITVGVVLVPQGLSYSVLAALPPQYGLYSSMMGPLVYTMLGTSVELQVGPFALISILVANTVGNVVDPSDPGYVDAVLSTSILVGLVLLLLRILKAGFIVNFLSEPVMSSITTGGAFLIGTSQLGKFFGVSLPRAEFFETWIKFFSHIDKTNVASMLIGLISLLLLYVYREFVQSRVRLLKFIPGALLVLVLSTTISSVANFSETYGVSCIGDIPIGIPTPVVPNGFQTGLIVPAISIAIVGYAISMATSKTFAQKNEYEVDNNQELFALGMVNIATSFFHGFPTFSSLSRSAIVYELKARTPMHNVATVLVIILVCTTLASLLASMPYSSLSAIIIDSLRNMFKQVTRPLELWKTHRSDAVVWVIGFLAVLAFDLTYGMVIAVVASFAVIIYQSAKPHFAELGQLARAPTMFRDLKRFPDAKIVDGIVMTRFDGPLNFASSNQFQKRILRTIESRREAMGVGNIVHTLVIDASAMIHCDSTGLNALMKLRDRLRDESIEIIFSNCRGKLRDMLRTSNTSIQVYPTNLDAVHYAQGKSIIPLSSEIIVTVDDDNTEQ